ncbi:MAG TPA: hypothetical protein VMJ14_11415 [Burkholderiales bacterium]|nr:hypothetical protein [Burkholderiales bacterium]
MESGKKKYTRHPFFEAEHPTLRAIGVALLWVLSLLAIAFGVASAAVGVFEPRPEDFSAAGWAFVMGLQLGALLGGGWLMLAKAEHLRDPSPERQLGATWLPQLGVALAMIAFAGLAGCLDLVGRSVLVLLLCIVLLRAHGAWSTQKLRTPFGRLTFAELFDKGVFGALYIVIALVLAALTAGLAAPALASGGAFGGGGASGDW